MPTPNDLATRYRITAHDTAGHTTTIHHSLTKPQAQQLLTKYINHYEQTDEVGILTADHNTYIILDHVTTLTIDPDQD